MAKTITYEELLQQDNAAIVFNSVTEMKSTVTTLTEFGRLECPDYWDLMNLSWANWRPARYAITISRGIIRVIDVSYQDAALRRVFYNPNNIVFPPKLALNLVNAGVDALRKIQEDTEEFDEIKFGTQITYFSPEYGKVGIPLVPLAQLLGLGEAELDECVRNLANLTVQTEEADRAVQPRFALVDYPELRDVDDYFISFGDGADLYEFIATLSQAGIVQTRGTMRILRAKRKKYFTPEFLRVKTHEKTFEAVGTGISLDRLKIPAFTYDKLKRTNKQTKISDSLEG